MVTLNPTVGDVLGNGQKILSFVDAAIGQDCALVIFPEMSLTGYPLKDLIRWELLLERQARILNKLKRLSKKITIIVGGILKHKSTLPAFQNVAYVFQHGQKHVYAKHLLPNYDVFDERRYFVPGTKPLCIRMGGLKFALTICEDIWFDEPRVKAFYKTSIQNEVRKQKPDYVITLSASPFEINKRDRRLRLFHDFTKSLGTGLIFVNQMGGNDDLIFDGQVCVSSRSGQILMESPSFTEALHVFDTDSREPPQKRSKITEWDELKNALVTGIRDYVHKSGNHQVLLGLSGGIDSALVAQLAALALGPQNVLGVLLPSRYSSRGSVTDALTLAKNLKFSTQTVNIEPLHHAFEKTFKSLFDKTGTTDITAQNIQARIRGNILMAMANNTGRLLLNTTNKSEMTMGYGTLYGDMCGAIAVLSDLTKANVYALARFLNPGFEFIPREIMQKAPSAELKPGQKDSDSLPPYDELDPLVEQWIETENVTEKDFKNHPTLIKTLCRNEYKRQQAPMGFKVTAKAFGSGRRYPIITKL